MGNGTITVSRLLFARLTEAFDDTAAMLEEFADDPEDADGARKLIAEARAVLAASCAPDTVTVTFTRDEALAVIRDLNVCVDLGNGDSAFAKMCAAFGSESELIAALKGIR